MREITEARNALIDTILDAARSLSDPYFGQVGYTREKLQKQFATYELALLKASGVAVREYGE